MHTNMQTAYLVHFRALFQGLPRMLIVTNNFVTW